jgi:hypothetical protein
MVPNAKFIFFYMNKNPNVHHSIEVSLKISSNKQKKMNSVRLLSNHLTLPYLKTINFPEKCEKTQKNMLKEK